MKLRLTLVGLAAGLTAQAGLAMAADPFTVTSSAYKDGDVWPSKFAGSDPSRTNPPCPGQNVSPPLSWSNAPEATKSFAIVMFDPDGGNGTGANHWIAYDIPKTKTSLAEGEASVSPKDWLGGKNNAGTDHYFGPCGPAGHALHHYIITVLATSLRAGHAQARPHARGAPGGIARQEPRAGEHRWPLHEAYAVERIPIELIGTRSTSF